MAKKKTDTYGLTAAGSSGAFVAPELPYQPPVPRKYRPAIGLIACGGITQTHLTAYKKQGYNVVAMCDLNIGRAEKRRAEFYPDAKVYTDFRELLRRPDIDVVDVATHPAERAAILPECLKARKHVLSQKPFVLDLRLGEKLVDLAEKYKVRLAVNQNGRWAPHVSYMRQAINKGLIGEVLSAHMAVHWNHDWVAGSPFDHVRYLILYDFAIHWFDMVHCYMRGKTATKVYASDRVGKGQTAKPPLFGQAQIEFADAQASLVFDGYVLHGAKDRTFIAGTKGTLSSDGPDLVTQTVTLTTPKGAASPKLEGKWFPDGMAGTMGELLSAIEARREPSNNAADNLKSLAVCFAACKSAQTGKPQVPGKVLTLVK